jgi:hypothetical protein
MSSMYWNRVSIILARVRHGEHRSPLRHSPQDLVPGQ